MDIQYPLINGFAFSFRSIELNLGGKKIRGFKEIKYDHGVEPGEGYGPDQVIQVVTRGKYKANGSLIVWQHEWEEIRKALGHRYMNKVFTGSVCYAESGGPIDATVDTLVGVRIIKVDKGASEGDEPNEVNLALHIRQVIEGGLLPV